MHSAVRTHTQKSKGTVGPAVDHRPQEEALPVISAGPNLRIAALFVHASRPMAPGPDHHRHGETEPVGLKVVQTLLC